MLLAAGVVLFLSACQQPVKEPAATKHEASKYFNDPVITHKVDSVLSMMTLDEKIGQLTLYSSGWDKTGPSMNENYINDIKAGRCGNIFNAFSPDYNRKLQKICNGTDPDENSVAVRLRCHSRSENHFPRFRWVKRLRGI